MSEKGLVAQGREFVVIQQRDELQLHGPGINVVIRQQPLPQLDQNALNLLVGALDKAYHEGQRKKMREIKDVLEIDPCRFRG